MEAKILDILEVEGLAAACERLNLPASTGDYTPADWKRHNAVTSAWLDKQNQPPPGGGMQITDLTADSATFGGSYVATNADIDDEEAFDQAAPGSPEAIALAARISHTARRHADERSASLRAPRRPSCARRTVARVRARARSGLRGGRPARSQPSARSRRSSSSGDGSSGDTGPGESGEGEPPAVTLPPGVPGPHEASTATKAVVA